MEHEQLKKYRAMAKRVDDLYHDYYFGRFTDPEVNLSMYRKEVDEALTSLTLARDTFYQATHHLSAKELQLVIQGESA